MYCTPGAWHLFNARRVHKSIAGGEGDLEKWSLLSICFRRMPLESFVQDSETLKELSSSCYIGCPLTHPYDNLSSSLTQSPYSLLSSEFTFWITTCTQLLVWDFFGENPKWAKYSSLFVCLFISVNSQHLLLYCLLLPVNYCPLEA